jgi:SAM-dependent methyltransferase/UDP-N-acetylglucosamine transferase subunit ALG13
VAAPGARLRVVVTVGMGPWPFDRLLEAVRPLCAEFDVFAQTGTSKIELPCATAAFVGFAELEERLRTADVVVTHAGNTVRLAQRMGKVPVAVAREARRGEMRNDHQVEYLAAEVPRGRVVALRGEADDGAGLGGLPAAVRAHPAREPRMLGEAPPLPRPDPVGAGELLEQVLEAAAASGPFDADPLRRFAWAWSHLVGDSGSDRPAGSRHLDLGIGDGAFTAALARRGGLDVVAADAHPGYLRTFRATYPEIPAVRVREGLPFADASFASASLLDSLEHTPDDAGTLREVARVLRPGGRLVLTVPARHAFSLLDPDDAKLRLPRLHAAVYRARFGAARHHERFVDDSNGLRGDLAWNRTRHTNYDPAALLELMAGCGLEPVIRDGANLFWRLLQVPELLAPAPAARLLRPLSAWDARHFHRANLFVVARRT